MLRLALFALVLAGCGGGKTEIDLTLTADGTLGDGDLARVKTFHVEAGDPDAFSQDVDLMGHVLQRTERLVYRPRVSAGVIPLTIDALDENGLVACSKPAAVALLAGGAVPLEITLHACSGAPGDGGVPDLSGADLSGVDLAVPDAGPSQDLQPPDGGVLCPSGAVVCDDFEGDLSKWDTTTSNGTTTIDTAQARHGTHSVHVHVPGPATGSAYQQQFFGYNTSITYPIYVRSYVYIPSGTLAFGGNISFLNTNVSSTVILGYSPNSVWGLGSQNLATGEVAAQPNSTINVAANTWTCLEWLIDAVPPNGSGGSERLSINGVDDPALHVDQVHLNTESFLLFGWTALINAGQSADIWFDDIAVAHTPMGCPP